MKKHDRNQNDNRNNDRVISVPTENRNRSVQKQVAFAAPHALSDRDANTSGCSNDFVKIAYTVAKRRGLRDQDAQDVAQNTILSLLKQTSFEDPEFEKKVRNRARCRSISFCRLRWVRRRQSLDDAGDQAALGPSSDNDLEWVKERVREAVSRLSNDEQTLMRLRFDEELTLKEIAESELMGRSLAALKSLSSRTNAKLRPKLRQLGLGMPSFASNPGR